ncbi:alpha/beta hydrolase [Taklimakanibacter lacteus]|uniref:alpha/beta hydrolase n=1 Tax=Taklimakanibacter lacteus TaxID=2268456 RepID=UPI000E66355C
MRLLALLVLLAIGAVPAKAQEPVSFTTSDGITVYGDYYAGPRAEGPVILAFHQAGFNRLEYREIAPRLVKDGFSVLAIDQRSGGNYGEVENRTAKEAKGFWVFTDALPDLEAALNRAREKHPKSRIIAWGSSYSASLAIILASKHKDVAGVLAFSPGEYFDGKPSVRAAAKEVTVPVFITSRGDKEKVIARLILEALASKDKTQFIPDSTGVHGSSALLQPQGKSDEYWKATEAFLANFE